MSVRKQNRNPTSGRGNGRKNPNQTPQNNSSKQRNQKRSNAANASFNTQFSGQNLGGFGPMRSAPVSMSKTNVTARPRMMTRRNGDCFIAHREYIQEIVGPSTGANFNCTQLSINPGQSSVFQWLSNVAKNFESYKFRKLRFLYETEAPSSLAGTLIMAVDYDASDAALTSKQQMMAFRGSVRSAPWTPCSHSSISEDLNKEKTHFVRPGAQPANTDIKLYDVGTLNVATQGLSSNTFTCGELYVEYEIDLMTPLYVASSASATLAGGLVTGGGTISSANPLGSVPVLDAQVAGMSVDGSSNVTFAAIGTYCVQLYVANNTATALNGTGGTGAPTVTKLNQVLLSAASATSSAMFAIVTTVVNSVVAFTVTTGTTTASFLVAGSCPTGSLT